MVANEGVTYRKPLFWRTGMIPVSVPRPVLLCASLGTVLYAGEGSTTINLASVAGTSAGRNSATIDPDVALMLLSQALNVQGMELPKRRSTQAESVRLRMFGAAPILVAWSTLALQPMTALADTTVCGMRWTPAWYSQYRLYHSTVGTCIIGSLAGTSYYGPVAGHGFLHHDLELTRDVRKQLKGEKQGFVDGPVQALEGNQAANAWVMLKAEEARFNEGG
ncbi:hypothetical protein GYMLUDRAFT_245412 [Collybiopsis luxurians FD-317 M1]|uniref:Uncharacterized protein n=1 Tax=Collybiopsis luxurians FD-317 M1 TaxID=944289 RepID=A0A0D0CLB4_9AGAR|nr:hypothetical protein GYMLUDRAFT_245412 [Collybiopsis luxurians FD-317 M1]